MGRKLSVTIRRTFCHDSLIFGGLLIATIQRSSLRNEDKIKPETYQTVIPAKAGIHYWHDAGFLPSQE